MKTTYQKTENLIFKILFKEDVLFAICIANTRFKFKWININEPDYFIIIHPSYVMTKTVKIKKDDGYVYRKLRYIGGTQLILKEDKSNPKPVYVYDLSADEAREFRHELKHLFVRSFKTEDGTVYELEGKSFLERYNNK